MAGEWWEDPSERDPKTPGEGSPSPSTDDVDPDYKALAPFEPFDPLLGEITPDRLNERSDYLREMNGDGRSLVVFATTTFAAKLTVKQRRYGVKLLEVGPDRWREAALFAGYSAGVSREKIEESPALIDFMAAFRNEVAISEAITLEGVRANIDRIGKKAEAVGEYGVALRAEKLKGDTIGAFGEKEEEGTRRNDGVTIIIQSGRSEADTGAVIDAEYQEVMAMNERNWTRPDPTAPTLPMRADQ